MSINVTTDRWLVKMKNVLSEENKMIMVSIIISIVSVFSPYIGISIMAVLACKYAFEKNYKTVLFFVCIILFQNMTAIVGAYRFNRVSTTLFLLMKEIMIYGCVSIGLIRMRKVGKGLLSMLFFGCLLGTSFLLSDAPFMSRFISLRELLLPFVCFGFGYVIQLSDKQFRGLVNFIVKSAMVVGLIGLMEKVFWGMKIWEILPLNQYNINKGTEFSFYRDVIPMNYVTFDFLQITGKTMERLVSIFADPLITGHYLFLAFLLADYYSKKNVFIKLFLIITSLLTLSKGIMLSFIIYGVFSVIKLFKYSDMKKLMRWSCIVFSIGLVVFYRFMMAYAPNSATIIHINGFIRGLSNLSVLGSGLGKAGTITGATTGTAKSLLAAESYIGILIIQVGLVGFAFFAYSWFEVFRVMFKTMKIKKNSIVASICVELISVMIESLFSESAITIVGTGLTFILAGYVYKNIKNNTCEVYDESRNYNISCSN